MNTKLFLIFSSGGKEEGNETLRIFYEGNNKYDEPGL